MKNKFFTTARLTGFWYLGLAITGVVSFLFAKTKIYIEGDMLATATNLVTQESLARTGTAAELALVAFQALAAVWFFRLFRKTNLFAAVSLASFGLVNAITILISNAFWLTSLIMATKSLNLSLDSTQIYYLMEMHESIWKVSGLFFGLWLIPMGVLVKQAKMPKTLGWILIFGGFGYIISAFLLILTPQLTTLIDLAATPATIGEFWIIGYLLTKKVRN